MKTLLRILVGEQWPGEAKAPWVLLAANGSVLQEGVSAPQHWPAAVDCEAVLSAPQAVWLRARMPAKVPAAQVARLVANALEDQMMDDPDRQHFTITDRDERGAGVLVVGKERLHQIVAQFAALGRPLVRAYSELQSVSGRADRSASDAWHLSLGVDSAVLRRNTHYALTIDVEDLSLPPILIAMTSSAQNDHAAPPGLALHSMEGAALPDVSTWASALGLPVQQSTPYRWHEIERNSVNLLMGEFAPRHRARFDRVRPALWVLFWVVAIDSLAGLGQIAWKRYQLSQEDRRVTQLFKAAVPNTPAIYPSAQIQRELDQLRAPLGLPRSDDFVVLLASLADALAIAGRDAVSSLRFQEGTLEVGLSTQAAQLAEPVRQQLLVRGLNAQVKADGGGPPRLTVRREASR